MSTVFFVIFDCMARIFSLVVLLIVSFHGIGQFKIKYLPLKKAERLNDVEHNIKQPECIDRKNEDGKTDKIVSLEISGIDPESNDERKAAEILNWDKKLEALRFYQKCPETEIIILKLAEGLFLKQADQYEVYSKAYYKRGYRLNAKRFKERYIKDLESWLPGKTILLTDWNW